MLCVDIKKNIKLDKRSIDRLLRWNILHWISTALDKRSILSDEFIIFNIYVYYIFNIYILLNIQRSGFNTHYDVTDYVCG